MEVVGDKTKAIVVTLVHWVSAQQQKKKNLYGRRVLLEDGCIKYSTPATCPKVDFKANPFWCIIGDTGQAMRKARKTDREKASENLKRVMDIYEVAVARASTGQLICEQPADDGISAISLETCFLGLTTQQVKQRLERE